MPVIAIASQAHSGGEVIASAVADALGYTLVNQRHLDHETCVVHAQARLAQTLAEPKRLLCGVATRLIPAAVSHVLHVGIVGQWQFRIENASTGRASNTGRTGQRILRGDRALSAWSHHHLGQPMWDPKYFDLLIPRPATTTTDAVSLVVEASSIESLLPSERSLRAQHDFRLGSQVRLALWQKCKLVADVTADHHRVVVRLQTKRSPSGTLARVLHALRQESRLGQAYQTARSVQGVKEVVVVPTIKPACRAFLDTAPPHVIRLSERVLRRTLLPGRPPRPRLRSV